MAKQTQRIVDVETLAKELNLSSRRIQQLETEGVIPKKGRGQYDLDKSFRAYVRYLQKQIEKRAVPTKDGGESSLTKIRVRRETAETELKEIELARARGQLVAIEDVEKEMTDLVLTTKARILAVPARVAPELVGEDSRTMIQAKIEKSLKDALSHLAKTASA